MRNTILRNISILTGAIIGLLFKVISLDEDKVTLLINQEERTVMYGEEFVVYSLIEVQDGASTSYRR